VESAALPPGVSERCSLRGTTPLGIYREKFKFAEYQDRDVENGRFSGHCEVLPIR
jgi:hypothetical protein